MLFSNKIIPLASPAGFTSALAPEQEKESLWFIFQEKQGWLLTSQDGKQILTTALPAKRSLYIGILNGTHLFASEIENHHEIPAGWTWNHLRSLFGQLSDEYFALAGRAMQLMEWDRAHKYCGCCGQLTVTREKERCRECPACGHLAYPKLAPATMALIHRENKILLARGPHFPEKFYSILAGFVDPGETLEQCVIREVFEEVGLRVQNVRYFGSQPWPFSNSLMIGFICEWQSGEIRIDPTELVDAAWFEKTNFPQLPPPLSLARIMIDAHFS